MTLYDLISVSETRTFLLEDIEGDYYGTYRYCIISPSDEKKLDKPLIELSKALTVLKIKEDGIIVVNLSELVKAKIDRIEESKLFQFGDDWQCVMDDLVNAFEGFVSDEWINKFVDIMRGDI